MSSLRLVVIDDSLTIRKSVELAMKSEGHHIDFASSGQEGIGRVTQSPPDIVFLDFVLPDMKGTDVVRALSTDARAKGVPVVLMTAKHENVRELFREFPQVVDYIAKPFTRQDIVSRLHFAVERRAQVAAASAAPSSIRSSPSSIHPPPLPSTAQVAAAPDVPSFSFAEKEEAAKAIFAQLRPLLQQIPAWVPGLGTTPPGMYFGKKILTPAVIGGLLNALTPAFQKLLGGKGSMGCQLQGTTAGVPILDILRILTSGGRTGELTLAHGAAKALVYVRRGEVVGVTGFDPVAYAQDSLVDLTKVPAADREKAETEQRHSAKPVYLTLAEAGHVPTTDLPAILQRQGRQLLGQFLVLPRVGFEWRETAVPPTIEAYARVIPLTQLVLDRMRQVSSTKELEAAVPSLQTIFARAERFSQKVRPLALTDGERKVLAFVDGKNTVQHIVDRSGMSSAEIIHVLHRLSEIQLIARTQSTTAARSVMILDPDVDAVHRPLSKWLSSRPKPLELVSLLGEADLAAAVMRERPTMVIVDASHSNGHAESLAQQIGSGGEAGSVTLVALLDAPLPGRTGELMSAGFDSVLTKPVQFREIEGLLGGG